MRVRFRRIAAGIDAGRREGVRAALERGQVFHSSALGAVDPKGRTSLPADYRKVAENRVRRTLTPDADSPDKDVLMGEHPRFPCLQGFDATYEEKLTAKLRAQAEAKADAPDAVEDLFEDLQARHFGVLEQVAYDGSGRIVLPAHLRDFAGLDGFAFFYGAGETFQVWNPDRFREHNPDNGPALRKLDALLAERRK